MKQPTTRPLLRRTALFGLSFPALAALLVLALTSLAAPVRAAERDKVEAFLAVTGFDVALDSIALSAGSAPKMLGLDPGLFGSEWTRLSREVFDTGQMRDMALVILVPALDEDALNHAAGFYATDLGQRLVEAENRTHMIEDDDEKQAEGLRLLERMRETVPDRAAMLERMNGAIDASGTSLRALQEIQFRFLMAASAAGVVDLHADADELRALLKQNEDALREAIRASALASAAYTYRDFSDAELAAYTEALEHPLMQEVYELLNAVQYEIMANRFEALAARMAGLRPGQDI